VGLVRLEDIAIGTAVSAGVALLFWPRGAGGELGAAMHDAYSASVELLAKATAGNERRSTHSRPLQPSDDSESAAMASRRLDDAFRTYLAERGAKPVPLSDVAALVTGVAILRLSAEAVVELGDRHAKDDDEWIVARQCVANMSTSIVEWYDEFASHFRGEYAPAQLTPQIVSDDLVIGAVREQLVQTREPDLNEAVRILWTADQLAAVQHLEARVVAASGAAEALWTPPRTRLRRSRPG
jgi:hypothetical protein